MVNRKRGAWIIQITLPSGSKFAATDKQECLALAPLVPGETIRDIWAFESKQKAIDHVKENFTAMGGKAKKFWEDVNWEPIYFPDAELEVIQ